jgi:hypothetical protein
MWPFSKKRTAFHEELRARLAMEKLLRELGWHKVEYQPPPPDLFAEFTRKEWEWGTRMFRLGECGALMNVGGLWWRPLNSEPKNITPGCAA